MEYKKDLLKKRKKSTFRIILGISFFIVSIGWVVARKMDDGTIRMFDWTYFSIMFLNGIVHTFEGFGFLFMSLFGKAYICIDEDKIQYKPDIFTKEKLIAWNKVTSIEYKPVRYQLALNDQTNVIMDISKLEYSVVQDFKNAISEIASGKGLVLINK